MATVTAKKSIDTFDGLSNTTAGDDIINAANGTANAGDVWNGGDGVDTLSLTSKTVRFNLSAVQIDNIEDLLSGRRNDSLTLSLSQFDKLASIDLGSGKDTLSLNATGINDIAAATLANLTGVEIVRLLGSSGDDKLTLSGTQFDALTLVSMGQGNDQISLTSQSSTLNALADANFTGVEKISAAAALTGVTMNLSLQTEGLAIAGSMQADTLTGGSGNDTISGGKGADALVGGAGIDTLDYKSSSARVAINLATGAAGGGDAAGDIFSGFENVTGSALDDRLTGDANANRLDGGAGKDMLQGGAGADDLIGGAARDTASYATSALGVTVDLDAGTGSGGDAEGDTLSGIECLKGSKADDTLSGTNGANTIRSDAGDDIIDGRGGNDRLTGSGGDDQISGGDGDDVLNGGTGNDTLSGGDGADRLIGSFGQDILTGGDGADSFAFKFTGQAGNGATADAITDFTSGLDKIALTTMDADRTTAGNQNFTFIGDAEFSQQSGELRYDSAAGMIYGDTTGDGIANFALNVGIGTQILEGDFLL